MPSYKHQLTRNKYDDAYVMGYHNGYHKLTYGNPYDSNEQPQFNVKYKNGWIDGLVIREEERVA